MSALLVAKQYLSHEFIKLFSVSNDKRLLADIKTFMDKFDEYYDEPELWRLLSTISEGWRLKAVFRVLSNDRYIWTKETLPLESIVLTGMSPTIDKYIAKSEKRPRTFKQLWDSDQLMRKEITATGFSPHAERDHFPIIVFEKNRGKGFRVVDGMRRMLLATIADRPHIEAWVGRQVKKSGKPMISESRAYFLYDVYQFSKTKSPELKSAIATIAKEIIDTYGNGREVIEQRVIGYANKPAFTEIFKEVLSHKIKKPPVKNDVSR